MQHFNLAQQYLLLGGHLRQSTQRSDLMAVMIPKSLKHDLTMSSLIAMINSGHLFMLISTSMDQKRCHLSQIFALEAARSSTEWERKSKEIGLI